MQNFLLIFILVYVGLPLMDDLRSILGALTDFFCAWLNLKIYIMQEKSGISKSQPIGFQSKIKEAIKDDDF